MVPCLSWSLFATVRNRCAGLKRRCCLPADGEEETVKPRGCFSETPSIKCNCANDRGCRRLDIVKSQFNAANATRHPELGGGVITVNTTARKRCLSLGCFHTPITSDHDPTSMMM